jgi:uncharacterized protein
MKIVLDTNVLLTSISPRSKDYWIFEYFLDEKFVLCITTEILLEYEEIVTREMGKMAAIDLMQVFENAPNVLHIHTWFRWRLIETDPDDNKFTDCAIACEARYLVSEDKHFKILKHIPFPQVDVIDVKSFKKAFEP